MVLLTFAWPPVRPKEGNFVRFERRRRRLLNAGWDSEILPLLCVEETRSRGWERMKSLMKTWNRNSGVSRLTKARYKACNDSPTHFEPPMAKKRKWVQKLTRLHWGVPWLNRRFNLVGWCGTLVTWRTRRQWMRGFTSKIKPNARHLWPMYERSIAGWGLRGLLLCWRAATGERLVILQPLSRGVETPGNRIVPSTAGPFHQAHRVRFQELIYWR